MERQLEGLQVFLDTPLIRRVRRNHGLEHATIHLLSRKYPDLRAIGRSDTSGFTLYGNVPTEVVQQVASQALERMRNGEHKLALHPNCGTNLVTAALLGTGATLLVLAGSEKERFGRLQRLPLLVTGLLLAAIMGQPLGMRLQQHVTTLGDPGDLTITKIERRRRGQLTVHRIHTQST